MFLEMIFEEWIYSLYTERCSVILFCYPHYLQV